MRSETMAVFRWTKQNEELRQHRITQRRDTAFQNAIDKGHLDITPASANFAGNYMYMYSDDTYDFFKDIDSRRYLKVSQAT